MPAPAQRGAIKHRVAVIILHDGGGSFHTEDTPYAGFPQTVAAFIGLERGR